MTVTMLFGSSLMENVPFLALSSIVNITDFLLRFKSTRTRCCVGVTNATPSYETDLSQKCSSIRIEPGGMNLLKFSDEELKKWNIMHSLLYSYCTVLHSLIVFANRVTEEGSMPETLFVFS